MKSCGQSTQSMQSLLGDKWETSGKQMGHKYKIMRPEHSEHPELTGRQVGDKCEIMRPSTQNIQSLLGDKCETSWRQMGDKCEIMRPELRASRAYWETTGRQVETNGRQVYNHVARALRASRAY